MTDLLDRADAHMERFPHHDLVAKLASRIRELEARDHEWIEITCPRCMARRRGDDGPTLFEFVLATACAAVALALFAAGLWYIHDAFKVPTETPYHSRPELLP